MLQKVGLEENINDRKRNNDDAEDKRSNIKRRNDANKEGSRPSNAPRVTKYNRPKAESKKYSRI